MARTSLSSLLVSSGIGPLMPIITDRQNKPVKENHSPVDSGDYKISLLVLEMGADDYITKPFSLRELEARIKTVLRRTHTTASPEGLGNEAPIVRGNLRIDTEKREVSIGERQVELTPKEFDLLKLFASN